MSDAMKPLFLDMDGVMNSLMFMRTRQGRLLGGRSLLERTCFRIDPEAIQHLNAIIDETGCVLVLSSAWRNSEQWKIVIEALQKLGCRGRFIGRTPLATEHDFAVFERYEGRRPTMFEPYPRGYEIQQWLDAHPAVTSFVILDDDPDMVHLHHRLVLTDPVVGLQECDAARAIEMLR